MLRDPRGGAGRLSRRRCGEARSACATARAVGHSRQRVAQRSPRAAHAECPGSGASGATAGGTSDCERRGRARRRCSTGPARSPTASSSVAARPGRSSGGERPAARNVIRRATSTTWPRRLVSVPSRSNVGRVDVAGERRPGCGRAGRAPGRPPSRAPGAAARGSAPRARWSGRRRRPASPGAATRLPASGVVASMSCSAPAAPRGRPAAAPRGAASRSARRDELDDPRSGARPSRRRRVGRRRGFGNASSQASRRKSTSRSNSPAGRPPAGAGATSSRGRRRGRRSRRRSSASSDPGRARRRRAACPSQHPADRVLLALDVVQLHSEAASPSAVWASCSLLDQPVSTRTSPRTGRSGSAAAR